jgi:hypothetical protein
LTEPHTFKPSKPLSKLAQSAEKREDDARIVRELKDIASKRSDYDYFRHSQSHVLQNPKIPRFWKFAADFVKEYHRQESSVVAVSAVCDSPFQPGSCLSAHRVNAEPENYQDPHRCHA